jgi:hypothetical protein
VILHAANNGCRRSGFHPRQRRSSRWSGGARRGSSTAVLSRMLAFRHQRATGAGRALLEEMSSFSRRGARSSLRIVRSGPRAAPGKGRGLGCRRARRGFGHAFMVGARRTSRCSDSTKCRVPGGARVALLFRVAGRCGRLVRKRLPRGSAPARCLGVGLAGWGAGGFAARYVRRHPLRHRAPRRRCACHVATIRCRHRGRAGAAPLTRFAEGSQSHPVAQSAPARKEAAELRLRRASRATAARAGRRPEERSGLENADNISNRRR